MIVEYFVAPCKCTMLCYSLWSRSGITINSSYHILSSNFLSLRLLDTNDDLHSRGRLGRDQMTLGHGFVFLRASWQGNGQDARLSSLQFALCTRRDCWIWRNFGGAPLGFQWHPRAAKGMNYFNFFQFHLFPQIHTKIWITIKYKRITTKDDPAEGVIKNHRGLSGIIPCLKLKYQNTTIFV